MTKNIIGELDNLMLKKPTIATLFSGGGGDTLGFTSAGFKLVFANDNNLDACNTLRNRFESNNKKIIHHGNIANMNNFTNSNVISGGFPCQGFSVAGPRKITDNRNVLYKDLKRAICAVKPEFFVAENVKGFVTLGETSHKQFFKNGKIIKLGKIAYTIIKELSDIGYKISYELHNARDYGVPQDRERIIIVGVRSDLDFIFKFPKPTHSKDNYISMEKYGVKKVKIINSEIYREKKGRRKDYFSSRYMSRNRIRKWTQPSFTIPAEASQVPACPDCKRMWNIDVSGKNKPRDYDIPKFYKKHFKNISKELIRLSWRQCAAIQGFPKNYEFVGDLQSKYKQIGNAVPPPLMNKIAKCIMPYFYGKTSSF